jgi:hypothetical protein
VRAALTHQWATDHVNRALTDLRALVLGLAVIQVQPHLHKLPGRLLNDCH